MNVQCSWKVSDGRPISDAVFYNRETEDADLEDEINVENCVFLKAPDQSDGLYPTVPACQLLICCEPPTQITRISAICEARVIEIYGHHGEYLKTVFNCPLEETENLFVYRGDVTLDKPLSVCSVKFVNLESQNEMWLFGVKIYTDKMAFSPQNQGIPFTAIQQKLEGMRDSVEDKEALKRFTDNLLKIGFPTAFQQIPTALQQIPTAAYWKSASENLQGNWCNPGQGLPNYNKMQDINLKNMEEETQDKKEEIKKELSDSDIKAQPSNINNMQNLVSASTSPVMFLSQSVSTQTEEDYTSMEVNLKTYINEQMQSINKRFLEMEAKMLCKLEEIESFVKPHGVQSN